MLVILLLLAINCNAEEEEEEHKIPEELTSHPNWKLLDLDDRCGIAESSRIIGGTEARLGQYPWIVRLGYKREDFSDEDSVDYECGGSIINLKYILTAAHCGTKHKIEKSNKVLVQVRAGEHNALEEQDCANNDCAEPVQDLDVEEEICHPGYTVEYAQDDICLLRLNGEIKTNMYVSPICLPAFEFMFNTSFTGEIMETAGWGIINEEDEVSEVLRTLQIPVVEHNICQLQYSAAQIPLELTEKQICAGGEIGKDSCGGDSGGPLMKICSVNSMPRYFLWGVTSLGQTTCGQAPIAGVYTKVTKYWKWILDNIKE